MIYIDDHIDLLDLREALAAASDQRREHALRYRREQDQRLCLAAYQLLRRALLVEYGIDEAPVFQFGEQGKPMIAGHPDIHFSLSHCAEAAACVVASTPVGIDVESLSAYDPELAEATMSDEERLQIHHSTDEATAFMRLWTMKESLLKLTGEGIAQDMGQVLGRGVESNYQFQTTIYPRFVCTVCSERGDE